MLTDINLLPQQERKSKALQITVIAFVVLSILGALYFSLEYRSLNNQMETTQTQLDLTVELRQVEQQKIDELISSTGAQALENMVTWLEEIPISTVAVLGHLTELLPERGYFLNYAYDDQGQVNLSVLFHTAEEAATYLHHLQHSEWTTYTYLSEVAAVEVNNNTRYTGQYYITLDTTAIYEAGKGEE